MKYFSVILLLCACPVVYGQSVKKANSNRELTTEKSVEIELNDSEEVNIPYQLGTDLELDADESAESELTDSDEAGIPFMFTMTSGPVETVGRILLSSSDGKTGSVPIVVEPNQQLAEAPVTFAVYQNYPNPFNPTTTLEFDLPEQSIVTLKMYNTLGQEVATLIQSELMDEGSQEVEFDASELPSGVYFYRLVATQVSAADGATETLSHTSVKKMLLVK